MNLEEREDAIEVRVGGSVLAYRCTDAVEVGDTVRITSGYYTGREAEVTRTWSYFRGALHDCRKVAAPTRGLKIARAKRRLAAAEAAVERAESERRAAILALLDVV